MNFKSGDKAQELKTGLWGTMKEINGALIFEFETKQDGKQSKQVFKPDGFVGYNGVLHPQDAPFSKGTYKECLRESLLCHPSLCPSEIEVLHQLFFVNGNGYSWVDGKLEDICGSIEKSLLSDRKLREHYKKQKAALLGQYDDGDLESDDPEVQRAAWAQYTKDMRVKLREQESIYPLCVYAKILNVPFNVRPDWLRAARKALNEVPKTKACTPNDTRYLGIADELLKHIEQNDLQGHSASILRLFTAEEIKQMNFWR